MTAAVPRRTKILSGLVLLAGAFLVYEHWVGLPAIPSRPSGAPSSSPYHRGPAIRPVPRSRPTPKETSDPEAYLAQHNWGRDPFVLESAYLRPEERGVLDGTLGSLRVTGIIWGNSAPKAIINDLVMGTGDEIHGFQILRILPNGVVLGREGRHHLLPLRE
ncbi:MAG: hypothetical protein ACE5HK_08175 [Candidatus Methylomirabilales bacterium]